MKEAKYMSKEYTSCLRGIFAILVVVHHLYQYSGLFRGTYLGTILQLLGFLSVSVFFFFSGYGMMLSSNKKDYVEKFFYHRIMPLYLFYVFLIVMYTLWTLFLERNISLSLVFRSFFFGGTIVTNGWYLQVTFFIYALYLFVFRRIKSHKRQVFAFSTGIFLYCILCRLINLGLNWYQTVPCVILGMIHSWKKDCIDLLLKRYSWGIFASFGLLFSISFVLSAVIEITALFDVLYSVFFVCAMIALSYILCNTPIIENKITKWCGKYSLTIYVTHGLFLRLFKLEYIKDVSLYIFVVIIGTVVMSMIIDKVHIKIFAMTRERVLKMYST